MITIYTETNIRKKFPKGYIFLKKEKVLDKYICALNTLHSRKVQFDWWSGKEFNAINCISVFSWVRYRNTFGETPSWHLLHTKFIEGYDNMIVKHKLIKII